jgi:hypothetical protein
MLQIKSWSQDVVVKILLRPHDLGSEGIDVTKQAPPARTFGPEVPASSHQFLIESVSARRQAKFVASLFGVAA